MDDTEDVFPAAVRLDAALPARRDSPLPPSILYGGSVSIRETKDRDIRHDF